MNSQGSFDAGIEDSEDYKNWFKNYHSSVTCSGGNQTLCDLLEDDISSHDTYPNFLQWQYSAAQTPNLAEVKIIPISTILYGASDDSLRTRSTEFAQAFEYISAHPRQHKTYCSLFIESDFGELVPRTARAYRIYNSLSRMKEKNRQRKKKKSRKTKK